MHPRRHPKPFPLSDFRQPSPPLRENRGIHAFRHQHHPAARGANITHDRVHLLHIAWLTDHKLKLIRIKLNEPAQDLRLLAQAIVLIGPAPVIARVRRRICELRADAHQVATDLRVHRAGGLYRDVLRQPFG